MRDKRTRRVVIAAVAGGVAALSVVIAAVRRRRGRIQDQVPAERSAADPTVRTTRSRPTHRES